MKIGIAARIVIIIGIQIILIAASFAYLSIFESKNSLLGNSINIAGKNRFLTSNVLLQSQYYLSGSTSEDELRAALSNLKSNIVFLRDGGNLNNIELDPIPSQHLQNWQTLYGDYLALEESIDKITEINSQEAIAELKANGNQLIATSDSLVGALGDYSNKSSEDLLTLQISLGALNIAVHGVMLSFILRILNPIRQLTNATKEIQKGNLEVSIKQNGSYELRELSDSFNSMVQSLKKSSELLVKEQKKYQELYDNAPDLYRMVDTNGILRECNQSYWKTLGYSKAELIGKSVIETTAEKSRDAIQDSLRTWKETGSVSNREIWLKRKDGSIFPTLLSATALRDERGNIVASNTCIIDVTEIYEARKELEAANVRLKELDTLKTEFISVASHELRTPIQPILSYAELAQKGIIDQAKAWQVVTQEAQRLKALANNILDASRIEGGNLKLSPEYFSINDAIRDIVHGFDASSSGKARITTQLAPDELMIVKADKSRIIQVVANLIGNAVKFAKEREIRIETKSVIEDHYVEMEISDSSGGIPPEIMPKLFSRFATKGREKGTESGTGLGLFISKGIIEAHGGRIVGYNNEIGGATFKIWLKSSPRSSVLEKSPNIVQAT